jgi:glycosyltransferase involved in cell wall biosynthesis
MSGRKLRLVLAHNGVAAYDSLFVKRFAAEFETYFVTFARPTQDLKAAHVTQLPDLGPTIKAKRLNNLRIFIATLWRILQMKRYLDMVRPDIVIGNWVTTYGLYTSACGWKPFVLFAWGSDVLIDPHRSFLHRYITRRVLSSAEIVVVDSDVQRRAILELGCDPRRIISFPWVTLDDLRDIAPDPSYRKQLGWQRKRIIVSNRKHEPLYDVRTLVEAIPSILAHAPDTRFLIFGEGTQTPLLKRRARELEVERFIHFAGDVPRNRLLGYVMDCDLYVSTSLSDGCSSSLLEAMSLSLPVVVTSIPGNTEWVSNGHTGVVFNGRDHGGLAKAILWLFDNPQEAAALGQKAKREIHSKVNWTRATSELVQRIYSTWERYA